MPHPRCHGFSLVEVTLAIGIVSFSLLAVLGLMPVGLSTLRQATEQTVESQIVQKLGGEASLTSFSKIGANFSGRTFYYDDQGRYLTNSPATVPTSARYWAFVSLSNSIYPGSSNAPSPASLSNSLVWMRIDISTGGASGQNRRTNSYGIQVPNFGN